MTASRPDLGKLRIDRTQTGASEGQRRALIWVIALAVIAAAFIAVVLLYVRRSGGTNVRVARVEVSGGGGGSVGITANGYVVARTRASVSSKLSGRLASLAVEEGTVVRKNQVLAEIENADYAAAVSQAVADSLRIEAQLREAEALRDQVTRDLTRNRELVTRNLEPRRTVEDLESQLAGAEARIGVQKAQVAAAQASIAYARANYENTYIRAP